LTESSDQDSSELEEDTVSDLIKELFLNVTFGMGKVGRGIPIGISSLISTKTFFHPKESRHFDISTNSSSASFFE